jgi:hypothetical protein
LLQKLSKDENRLTSEVPVNLGTKHERGQARNPAISFVVENGTPICSMVCSGTRGQVDAEQVGSALSS